jgi:stress-induced morphogen
VLAPEDLEARIRELLPDAQVYVRSLSGSGDQLEARVVSEAFVGKKMAERHRLIYEPLRELLRASAVQALALETFCPEQWEQFTSRGA